MENKSMTLKNEIMGKINEKKVDFFEKIVIINKSLAKLT